MIVGGHARACFNYHRLSSTIIDYHASFDRSFKHYLDVHNTELLRLGILYREIGFYFFNLGRKGICISERV